MLNYPSLVSVLELREWPKQVGKCGMPQRGKEEGRAAYMAHAGMLVTKGALEISAKSFLQGEVIGATEAKGS